MKRRVFLKGLLATVPASIFGGVLLKEAPQPIGERLESITIKPIKISKWNNSYFKEVVIHLEG